MAQIEKLGTMQFKNVSFAYDSGAEIFSDLSMSLPEDRAVWLRGGSGSGKSTLLKLLAGLAMPTSGSYWIGGVNVSEMSFEEFLPYRLAIGYGFDSGGLLNNKTIEENLMLPLMYHKLVSPQEALARVEEVVSFFGLSEIRDRRPFAISGSQRKLVCVVRPFIHWPQVILLDDPITGLKGESVEAVANFIFDGFERRGVRQVIFSGDDRRLAQALGARELVISKQAIQPKMAA